MPEGAVFHYFAAELEGGADVQDMLVSYYDGLKAPCTLSVPNAGPEQLEELDMSGAVSVSSWAEAARHMATHGTNLFIFENFLLDPEAWEACGPDRLTPISTGTRALQLRWASCCRRQTRPQPGRWRVTWSRVRRRMRRMISFPHGTLRVCKDLVCAAYKLEGMLCNNLHDIAHQPKVRVVCV